MSVGCITPPLTRAQIMAMILSADGAGSGLDADTVRGREPHNDARFLFAPPFTAPPTYGDTLAQYLFGR